MKRTALVRKTPLRRKAAKPKGRKDWIATRPKTDISRMDCCPEAEARAAALVVLGCICCGKRGAEIHHLRKGMGKSVRSPWWRTIPLCAEHHREGRIGVAVHAGPRAWAWCELALLEETDRLLALSQA